MKFALVLALAGCGRLGFAELPGVDDATIASDAMPDSPSSGECSARKVQGFDFGASGITDLAAAQVDDGYAVGAIYAPSTFWGVHLDTQLVPDTPGPNQTSPVLGFNGLYTNGTLFFDGTNLDGALSINDGTAFQKTFPTDMTMFNTTLMRTGQVGEPSIARANGTTLVSTWFHDNVIEYVTLNPDGTPDATDRIFVQALAANVAWVSAASSPSALIAYELVDGTCGIGAINDALATTAGPLGIACSAPYVHSDASDAVLFYGQGGTIYGATALASTAPNVVVGTPVPFGPGREPVVWRIGGNRWAAWRDDSRLRMSAVSAISDVTIANAPSGPPDAYTPAGPYLFAVWGADLWAITCP